MKIKVNCRECSTTIIANTDDKKFKEFFVYIPGSNLSVKGYGLTFNGTLHNCRNGRNSSYIKFNAKYTQIYKDVFNFTKFRLYESHRKDINDIPVNKEIFKYILKTSINNMRKSKTHQKDFDINLGEVLNKHKEVGG